VADKDYAEKGSPLEDKPTTPCRDCSRAIRWCPDVSDPKGARCYSCTEAYRKNRLRRKVQ